MTTTQCLRHSIALVTTLLLAPLPAFGQGGLTRANPHWNITLTDSGYSDLLLANTPGFEGREYLSDEWGAAVGDTTGSGTVTPKWLDPLWAYPDRATNSTFSVITPIHLTDAPNADGLPIAEFYATLLPFQFQAGVESCGVGGDGCRVG
jgi:hypothetical protein